MNGEFGDDYVASHLPDVAFSGQPRTEYGADGLARHRWDANSRVGGAIGARIRGSGIVTVVTVDGQFVGTLDNPIQPTRLDLPGP